MNPPAVSRRRAAGMSNGTPPTACRVPVVPATIATTTREAVHLVRTAHQLGAAGVMVAPIVPELYAGRSRSDVKGFYEAVADATPLPVILFHYPSLTGVDLTPGFLAAS